LYAASNSRFEEGKPQTYLLDDIGPGAFRIFVRWLYSQKLTAPPAADSTEEEEQRKLGDLNLVQLWILADRLLIRPLQNCAMKTMGKLWVTRSPTVEWVHYAYKYTAPGSPLRKLAADLGLWGHFDENLPEDEEAYRQSLPQEMLFDLFKVVYFSLRSLQSTSQASSGQQTDNDNEEDSMNVIIDEEGDLVDPDSGEPFFTGAIFGIHRTMRSYLVQEDD
jgi:hypothetical protein